MNLAREWTAFAGALFSLMGLSLAAAARLNAEAALSWQRQWRTAVGAPEPVRDERPRRRLVLAYRLGGLAFGVLGVGLSVSAAIGRAPFASFESGHDVLVGGIFFTASGAAMAVNALRAVRRAPRFLDGELLDADSPTRGERVASACSRAMIALFLVFGLRLLRESLR